MTVLYIKHMVSNRCKYLVETELNRIGIKPLNIELGRVEIDGDLSKEQRSELEKSLKESELILMEDKNRVLIQKIKQLIHDMLEDQEDIQQVKFSSYLGEKLCMNYTYISNIFSEFTGCTIEQYIIKQKIERVKALLLEDESNLTQISYLLNYSSVAHLSNQFKKVTGIAPTQYKRKAMNGHLLSSQVIENEIAEA